MRQRKNSIPFIWGIVMILILAMPPNATTKTDDAVNTQKDVLQQTVNDYQDEIETIKKDLINLRDRIAWLNGRIHRIQSAGRPVPPELPDTVSLLKKKETILEKELKKIEPIYKKHKNNFNQYSMDEQSVPVLPGKSGKGVVYATVMAQLKNELQEAGIDPWVLLTQTNTGIVVTLALPVVFGKGKTTVSEDYKPFFTKMGSIIKSYDAVVEINSFTRPDTPEDAMDLGVSRAFNVVKIMAKQGVSQSDFAIYNHTGDTQKQLVGSLPLRSVDIRFLIQGKKSS